jgi:hypothetical protein
MAVAGVTRSECEIAQNVAQPFLSKLIETFCGRKSYVNLIKMGWATLFLDFLHTHKVILQMVFTPRVLPPTWPLTRVTRSQFYDRELQRQRCKNLQRC